MALPIPLFFISDAKVRKIIEISKFFTLKKVNEMLKKPFVYKGLQGIKCTSHFFSKLNACVSTSYKEEEVKRAKLKKIAVYRE